ncbi:DUF502 domain-containing protein [Marinimicrobium sp. ABcell2]|uniref:DUF502 domain-containing protein n=1 Tax=Marinimicrobium sp. ABcell2 TaxID=3069751 RepID=UPI0027B5CAFC|nr:DUF502 domain-containing protein [Marinimicrobium sp. ABcell2]MDQ2075212.1 DUF502 domain-containing protein [Marinimicrobium sp. ABcell2]
MKRWRSFITLTLFGGVMVALPITIFILLVQWLLGTAAGLVEPLSGWLVSWIRFGWVADLLGMLFVLLLFFLIGLGVKTSVGRWLHGYIDEWLARFAPGYRTIREVVAHFLGSEKNSSLLKGQVCRAYIMGRAHPVSVTAIVTSRHHNGDCTVYVPTAPVPSSGFVYHLSADCVELLPHISVETALRTVISCGSGSHVISEPTPLESAETLDAGPKRD